MTPDLGSTRFASWTRRQAALALAALLLGTAACLASALSGVTRPVETRAGDTDADLYRKVVGRIHRGETPYDALDHVFREYNYPVRSVFNYRPPLLNWFLGRLPNPRWGQALLALIMGATALTAYAVLRRDGGAPRAAAGVVLMIGAFAYGFVADTYLYTEVWAGTLIALSVCGYALDRRALGYGAGLLALFLRELALPYGVVALALAWREGRRREASAWGAGLAGVAVYLGLHFLAVAPRIPAAGGVIHGAAWVHCGGLAFVLATCRVNLLLLAAPGWVTALYLPLALLGFWGATGDTARRAGGLVLLYLASFAVIGGIFNAYWGLLDAPLLPLGLVAAPAALRDLVSAAARRPQAVAEPVG